MKKQNIPKASDISDLFSAREIRIIKYLYREKTNVEIASLLGKSVRTVEGLREMIYQKAKVKSIVALVIFALKKGICKL